MRLKVLTAAILGAALTFGGGPAGAATYLEWAGDSALTIKLSNNATGEGDRYVDTTAAMWSKVDNLDLDLVAGTTGSCSVGMYSIQLCSGDFGRTGWLGYANWWTSSGRIVAATIKLNDYYFSQKKYDTAAWRQMAVCHEIGHTLGLVHRDDNPNNANIGSCLDFSADPSGTRGTNGTIANTRPGGYDIGRLDGMYADRGGKNVRTALATVASEGVIDGSGGEGLAAVPEPATWTLMIAGFGAVGMAMRRRGYTARRGRSRRTVALPL